MQLENTTPFAADHYAVCSESGADLLAIMVKGTYEFDQKGKLAIAMPQQPIELADQYYGEPGKSSLKYASDFSINKPATDIALLGYAYAPHHKAAETAVTLRIGSLQRSVKVFGDRYWKKTLGISSISSPAPFEKMPLIYELAFGGADHSHPDPDKHDYERRNPIGVGFRAKKSHLPIEGARLPNIEDPENLISRPDDKPAPAGFGFINPAWQPRLGYAGTYDEAWQKNRMPLLPADFDRRFFNAASAGLVYQGFLRGNESVEIAGAFRHGVMRFTLPGIVPLGMVEIKNAGVQPVALKLDKVVIEANDCRLILVWSGSMTISRQFQEIETIKCQINN